MIVNLYSMKPVHKPQQNMVPGTQKINAKLVSRSCKIDKIQGRMHFCSIKILLNQFNGNYQKKKSKTIALFYFIFCSEVF